MGHTSASSQTVVVVVDVEVVVVEVVLVEVVEVLVVVVVLVVDVLVVVLVHNPHINGHAPRTCARSSKFSHSHKPTKSAHTASSSQRTITGAAVVMVVEVVVVVHVAPGYAGARRMYLLWSSHVHVLLGAGD